MARVDGRGSVYIRTDADEIRGVAGRDDALVLSHHTRCLAFLFKAADSQPLVVSIVLMTFPSAMDEGWDRHNLLSELRGSEVRFRSS
jgi:hypothetical protein